MVAIRTAQRKRVEERRRILAAIVLDFEELREKPTPSGLAREMASRLKLAAFDPAQLFRPHLLDIWRPHADYFGRAEIDRLPGAAERNRMSRERLKRLIRRTKRMVAELEESRAGALLAQSLEEGWTPLDEDDGGVQ